MKTHAKKAAIALTVGALVAGIQIALFGGEMGFANHIASGLTAMLATNLV